MRLCYGLLLVFLAACGGSTSYSGSPPPPPPGAPPPPPPPPAAGPVAVAISGGVFSPDTITIRRGTTVRWTNQDGVGHSVTADNGGFTSGTIAGPGNDGYGNPTPGATYNRRFDTAGTIGYHCGVHPSMKGAVVVTP